MAKDIGCKKDCQVLNEIQRYIYKLNGIKVKFIWIVPSMERMQSALQRQAWFINKFTSKENIIKKNNKDNKIDDENNDNQFGEQDEKQPDIQRNKIWDSVLIIIHKPEPGADLIDECGKGAIAASNEYGNFNNNDKWIENKNIIGYCNIDWLPEKRQKKAQRLYNMQSAQDDKTLFYYYRNDEIESIVLKSLLLLPSTRIEWCKDKCIKCDWEGDKRFSNDIPCHTRSYWSHKTGIKPKLTHLGVLDKNYCDLYHAGTLVAVHPQPLAKKKYHPGQEYTRKITAMDKATGVARILFNIAGNEENQDDPKLRVTAGGILALNVLTLNLVGAGVGFVLAKDRDRVGCYDCCNVSSYDSTYWAGCTPVVSKSKRKNVKGYVCCMKEEGSEGCKQYYKCCPYSGENAQGCISKCKNCNKNVNAENENNCGFHWPCCDKTGKIDDLKNDELKCTKYCTFCDHEWGKSPGCSSNQKHNFEKSDSGDEKRNYNHGNDDAAVHKRIKKLLPRKNLRNPLIIIVCIEKYNDENKNVLTSRKDYNNWIDLFDKHLKFGKNIISNDIDKPLNKNDFLEFLDSIFVNEKLRSNGKKYDSIIFTYSGHGTTKDEIYFSDEKCLSLQSVFTKFDGGDDNLQSFIGLPKIFIIDMCRGNGVNIAMQPQQQVLGQIKSNSGTGLKFRACNKIDYNRLFHHRDNSFIKVFSITKGNASLDTGYLAEYLCQTLKDKDVDLKTTCFHDLVKIADLKIRQKSAMHCLEFISTAAFQTYLEDS